METRTTRFSGADWGDQLKHILLIGVGGIGSWTALNLARIGHTLYLVDPDRVDETNVTGGQMYRKGDVGKYKVDAVAEICADFGSISTVDCIPEYYDLENIGSIPITITGLDNMEARKKCFEGWLACDPKDGIFIDGRLTLEMFEVFTIRGNDEAAIKEYREKHLFSDEEAQELDCTTKQSTFGAMGISATITATLSNWLTNVKMGVDFREVPFYQRVYFPSFDNKQTAINN